MKKLRLLLGLLALLLLAACAKDEPTVDYSADSFAIYWAEDSSALNPLDDNSGVDLSAIKCYETPFMVAGQLAGYDSANNRINLKVSAQSLFYPWNSSGDRFAPYGIGSIHTFIVVVNGQAVTYGYTWPVYFSSICPWLAVWQASDQQVTLSIGYSYQHNSQAMQAWQGVLNKLNEF